MEDGLHPWLKNDLFAKGIAVAINTKLAMPISRVIAKTSITPNEITLIHLIMALIAAIFFSFHSYEWYVAGAAMFQLSMIFDLIDGQVARIKGMNTLFGRYFDMTSDLLSAMFVVAGICYGYGAGFLPEIISLDALSSLTNINVNIWMIGMLFLIALLFEKHQLAYEHYLEEKFGIDRRKKRMEIENRRKFLRYVPKGIITVDARTYMIWIGILINQTILFFLILSFIEFYHSAVRFFFFWNIAKDIKTGRDMV
ncbi:MAG: CDP-alcohol phosphatidyltransferase family protein [Thermoplasmata archaeon]|nr:CDP-alcohol phosphatidyltransferase family protein [Thermoplasmata archaeon]